MEELSEMHVYTDTCAPALLPKSLMQPFLCKTTVLAVGNEVRAKSRQVFP